MVSELDKTTLEISLKVMNSQVSTPPLIDGIRCKIDRYAWKSKSLWHRIKNW